MRKIYFIPFLFLVLPHLTFPQAEAIKKETILTYLTKLSYPEFSGVVLIAEKDSTIFKKAYGYSNLEFEIKNQVNTYFNIASITKTMTAVATLQLVDNGLLDLHTPIGKYLPSFPNKTVRDSVTAHQLLTHTSGLNNFLVNDFKTLGKLNLKSLEDYLPLFAKDSLLFSPGSQYSYSGSGYMLLGLLIEELSGKNYYHYLNDLVFSKAGMDKTLAVPIDSIVKNKANGYTSYFGEATHFSKNDPYLSKANPAGFYFSTAEDLLKFFDALRSYDFISETTTKRMMSPLVNGYYTNYGYGISVDKRFEQTIVGHTGGWYGVQCELMYFEDDEITVIILSNMDTSEGKGMNKVSNFIKHVLANKPL
jgi:CubicO group peptidase (beta-lactamase class C family)